MAVRDVFLVGILLFSFGLMFIVMNYIGNTINNSLLANPTINQTANTVTVIQNVNASINFFDYIFLAVFMGLTLGVVITSWFVRAHPIFTFIYFFMLVVDVMVSSIFSQIWVEFVSKSQFLTTLTHFPITDYLLVNLPYFTAVVGLLGLLLLFAKPQGMNVFSGGDGGNL